jgi:hypothetical protein
MADDEDKKEAPPVAAPESAAEPSTDEEAPVYSKAQFKRALARERAKDEAKLERARAAMAQTQPKPEAPKPETVDSPQTVSRAEFEQYKADLAYSQALLGIGAKLTPKQQKVLRSEFDPDNPEALKGSIAEIWPEQATATADTASTPEAPPSEAPSIAQQYEAAAPAAKPVEPSLDPVKWTRADIDRMQSQGTFLENIEKWRATLPGNTTLFQPRKKPPRG